jgi:hypothetical protein
LIGFGVAVVVLGSCAAREVPLGDAVRDGGGRADAAPDAATTDAAPDAATDAAPPPGGLGDPCASDNDCTDIADGRCVSRVTTTRFGDFCVDGGACTKACASDADCPDGALCTTQAVMTDGADTPSFCLARCTGAADCTRTGWSCTALLEGERICTPPLDPC